MDNLWICWGQAVDAGWHEPCKGMQALCLLVGMGFAQGARVVLTYPTYPDMQAPCLCKLYA